MSSDVFAKMSMANPNEATLCGTAVLQSLAKTVRVMSAIVMMVPAVKMEILSPKSHEILS